MIHHFWLNLGIFYHKVVTNTGWMIKFFNNFHKLILLNVVYTLKCLGIYHVAKVYMNVTSTPFIPNKQSQDTNTFWNVRR